MYKEYNISDERPNIKSTCLRLMRLLFFLTELSSSFLPTGNIYYQCNIFLTSKKKKKDVFYSYSWDVFVVRRMDAGLPGRTWESREKKEVLFHACRSLTSAA